MRSSFAGHATAACLALTLTLTLALDGAARAEPVPTVALVRNLNLVLNFPFAPASPDLVLSLEKIDADGYSFRSAAKVSAADALKGKVEYGALDLERAEDLVASHHIFTRFFGDENEHAGGTVLMASKEVFDELRTKGSTAIDVVDIPGEKGMVYTPGVTYTRKNFRGTLERVGVEQQRVIVDGDPTLLPVLHAHGTLKARDLTRQYDFWWANDPASRLLLHYKSEDYMEFRVVRIDPPDEGDEKIKGRAFEAAFASGDGGGDLKPMLDGEGSGDLGKMKRRPLGLDDDKDREGKPKKTCRATVNGVYFATGSAELLTPSRPALDRVAAMLARHPDWTITIEGHTDNVGGDDSNLILSKNRAQSVAQELIGHYKISPARLKTEGYGRKRPVEPNDTVEGRARNRRVEIARNC